MGISLFTKCSFNCAGGEGGSYGRIERLLE